MRLRTRSTTNPSQVQANVHYHYINNVTGASGDRTVEQLGFTRDVTKLDSILDQSASFRGQANNHDYLAAVLKSRYKAHKLFSSTFPQPPLRRQTRFDVKPCVHEKTTIKFTDPVVIGWEDKNVGQETRSQQGIYVGGSLVRNYYAANPLAAMQADNSSTSSTGYLSTDWFALLDRFNEACDSIIPSSFLLGETLIEGSIFIDALKLVLNPTSAIKLFFNRVVKANLKRLRLGQLATVARESSSAYLGYQFGVKPAINDIKAAIVAHIVDARLNWLRANSGSFLPIRVRSNLYSDITNTPFGLPYPNFPQFKVHCTAKYTTSVISAWGKVREDFDLRDVWLAYTQYFGLNKIVGLAWELIPFTFILDWFVNAQERINDLTRIRGREPYTEFRGLTASFKKFEQKTLYMSPNGHFFDYGIRMAQPSGPVELATLETSKYERYITIPKTSGVIDSRSLGSDQKVSLGAILVQRGTGLLDRHLGIK